MSWTERRVIRPAVAGSLSLGASFKSLSLSWRALKVGLTLWLLTLLEELSGSTAALADDDCYLWFWPEAAEASTASTPGKISVLPAAMLGFSLTVT